MLSVGEQQVGSTILSQRRRQPARSSGPRVANSAARSADKCAPKTLGEEMLADARISIPESQTSFYDIDPRGGTPADVTF